MKTIIGSFVVVIMAVCAPAQQTNALAADWQVATNAFGRNFDKAITFTYQSRLSGARHVEINEEIVRRWPEVLPVADESGLTQALVMAKVDQTNTPPEWRTGQCLRFQRTGDGRWALKSLCSTNDPGRRIGRTECREEK